MNVTETYKRYAEKRDLKGLKDAEVARQSGVTKMTLSDWKNGKWIPKVESLQKICRVIETSIDYVVSGQDYYPNEYYTDAEIAKKIQMLHDNPNLSVLFDTTQHVTSEDLDAVITILKRMANNG